MTSWTHIWQPILINRSKRPILDSDEYNIFLRDHIGLYQGKLKIVNRQSGRIYLTNKRVIFFDNTDHNNSMSLALDWVAKAVFIDGFLRSSPKVKLYLKGSGVPNDQKEVKTVDWVCSICSFNNHTTYSADDNQEVPKCVSCGVKTTKSVIERASMKEEASSATVASDDQCPRCTFINHPSLQFCELCGTELGSRVSKRVKAKIREQSPKVAISNIQLENDQEIYTDNEPYVKISFRKGGEAEFFKLVNEILEDIKWKRLINKGTINQQGKKVVNEISSNTIRGGGIYGLEQKGEERRKQNEIILSSSLDDLQQLMHKYQDLLKLSDSFRKMVRTKLPYATIIPPLKIKKSSTLYHSELSRHMSEYLTNYELTKNFSMITTQDLFANYNRYLILTQGFGTDLLSADDFNRAINLFEQLNLPIRIKYYENSGLVVIAPRVNKNYSEFIIQFLKEQEHIFKYNKVKNEILLQPDSDNFYKEQYDYFKGCTIAEISDHFSWSYHISIEEVERCVEEGLIVLDRNILGTFYFPNKFNTINVAEEDDDESLRQKVRENLIAEQSEITRKLQESFNLANSNNLINLDPDYQFGNIDQFTDKSPTPGTPVNESHITSLNELQDLKF